MQQAFDQAIGATPVSTVDVDVVVAKGRRRTFLRRFAVAGAAGGTAVAAVGIIAALSLATTPAPALNPTTAGAEPPGTAAVAAGAAPVRTGETVEQTKQRLAAALTSGLTAALPGVQISNGPSGQPGVSIYYGPESSPAARYDTDTVITTAAGASEVFLVSQVGGSPSPLTVTPSGSPTNERPPPLELLWIPSCADLPRNETASADNHRVGQECTDSTGPDGQSVVVITEVCLDCSTPLTYRHDVYVTWTNARVNLAVSRELKRDATDPALRAPVLTAQQLVAIATNPELTVTA